MDYLWFLHLTTGGAPSQMTPPVKGILAWLFLFSRVSVCRLPIVLLLEYGWSAGLLVYEDTHLTGRLAVYVQGASLRPRVFCWLLGAHSCTACSTNKKMRIT